MAIWRFLYLISWQCSGILLYYPKLKKFIGCRTKRTEVSRLCIKDYGVPMEERGVIRNTSVCTAGMDMTMKAQTFLVDLHFIRKMTCHPSSPRQTWRTEELQRWVETSAEGENLNQLSPSEMSPFTRNWDNWSLTNHIKRQHKPKFLTLRQAQGKPSANRKDVKIIN